MILTKQYVCRCLFRLLTHNQALKRKWILGDQPDVEGKSPKAHAAANQELVNWKMLFSLLNTFFPLSSWQSLWHTLGALVWKFTYCHSGDNRWSLSPHATSFKFPRGGTFFSWSGSHSGLLESDLLVYSYNSDVLKLCLELGLSQVHLSLIGTMREWGNNFPQLLDSSERWPFQDLMSTIWRSRLSTQLTSHYLNHEQDRNPYLILKSDDVWWENQSCVVNQGQATIWRKAP